MRALTIRQPHAQLILIGEKTVELRSWATRYRGALLICAGRRADYELAYPCGVTLCRATLVDVRPFQRCDSGAARRRWRPGLYAWLLADVRPVPQIPLRGRLGLFPVPPDVARRIADGATS